MSPHAVFGYVLVDLAVIITAARVFGVLARRLGQPSVIGEIAAGIVLGPTLLGALPGHIEALVFPDPVVPHLKVLAQLGLVLFMFTVGLELDVGAAMGSCRRTVTIALASVTVPFALGAALASAIYPAHGTAYSHHIPKLGFVLFMGVAMAITAFPVLARILAERDLEHTTVGAVALSAAAIGDVLAWTLLSVACAAVTGSGPAATLQILVLAPLFVVAMLVIVRPVVARMARTYRHCAVITPTMLSGIAVGVFACAAITQLIGIHEIFGAFVFGAIMPRAGAEAWRRDIRERLHQISVVVLLPVFFVIAGFGLDLRSFGHAGAAWQLTLIVAVAVVGKVGGAFAGARIERMSLRHSAAIAVLMNTRGLTELVVLLVGSQAGVLDTDLYTMMVIMTLVTTAMTGPLIRLIYPNSLASAERELASPHTLSAVSERSQL